MFPCDGADATDPGRRPSNWWWEFLAEPMDMVSAALTCTTRVFAMSICRFAVVVALAVAVLAAQDARPDSKEVKPEGARPAPIAPTPGRPGVGGNSWFTTTHQDLGTFYGHGEGVGIFKFRNPNNVAIEWRNLTGSCQCAKAVVRVSGRTYELSSKPTPNVLSRVTKVPGQPDRIERVQQITIEPGAEGEVEVHLDMTQVQGPKQATLDAHTTDPALPQWKLSFSATGAKLFNVSPADVQLNKMNWNEVREFTVTVSSGMQKDWTITRMEDAPQFEVSWERLPAANGATSWLIKGKYGPVSGDTPGGGVLKFHTDVQGGATFTVPVAAMVQGPLEVKPGSFLTLGLVRKGVGVKREVVFEPTDGFQLAVTEMKFEKLQVPAEYVRATTRRDGNNLVVELTVSEDTPTGLLKGDLVVGLNHPLVKEKRIMFNGFVR